LISEEQVLGSSRSIGLVRRQPMPRCVHAGQQSQLLARELRSEMKPEAIGFPPKGSRKDFPFELGRSDAIEELAAQSAWEYPVRKRQSRLPAREIDTGQTSFPLLAIANEGGVSHSPNGFRVELGCCVHPQLRGTGRRSATQGLVFGLAGCHFAARSVQ